MIRQQDSDKCLALVALVARYDPVFEELIKKPDRTCKYLSPFIQNQLISEASTAVKNKLLDEFAVPLFIQLLQTEPRI